MARSTAALASMLVLACAKTPPPMPDAKPNAASSTAGAAPSAETTPKPDAKVVAEAKVEAKTPPLPKTPPIAEPEEEFDGGLDIEYVPTPDNVVKLMLDMAKVGKDDVVYDLGCGDGRLLVAAAKRGAKGFGVDLDPERIAEARANIEKAGVGHLVSVERKNIFEVDVSPATVVTLYLLPELNVRLIPQLQKLKAGARIVSHDFDMQGVDYEDVKEIEAKHHRPPPPTRPHYVYLWKAPLEVTTSTPAP